MASRMGLSDDQAAVLQGLQSGQRDQSPGWAAVVEAKGAGRVQFVLGELAGLGLCDLGGNLTKAGEAPEAKTNNDTATPEEHRG